MGSYTSGNILSSLLFTAFADRKMNTQYLAHIFSKTYQRHFFLNEYFQLLSVRLATLIMCFPNTEAEV